MAEGETVSDPLELAIWIGTFRRGVAHTEMGSSPGKSAAKTTRFKHWECELDSP